MFKAFFQSRSLSPATSIGRHPRLRGCPHLVNDGEIHIGNDLAINSVPVQSHMITYPGGILRLGNNVHISYGCSIAAQTLIEIGDGVQIGPLTTIIDTDFHRVGSDNEEAKTDPVIIEAGVRIGARVTILRGTRISRGATIAAGALVSGFVPPDACFAGVPAGPVASEAVGPAVDVASVVQKVFGLDSPPRPTDGPETIPAWDSFGGLRLLMAVEEAFGVSLTEQQTSSAKTVGALTRIISELTNSSSSSDVPALVQKVFGLEQLPRPEDGPAQIPAWDSFGGLRLLMAVEETFGVSLNEKQIARANTVAGLAQVINEAKR